MPESLSKAHLNPTKERGKEVSRIRKKSDMQRGKKIEFMQNNERTSVARFVLQ